MQELETITAHYSEWGDTQWNKFGTLVAPQLLTWRASHLRPFGPLIRPGQHRRGRTAGPPG